MLMFVRENVLEMFQLQGGISEHGFKYTEVRRNSITKEKVK